MTAFNFRANVSVETETTNNAAVLLGGNTAQNISLTRYGAIEGSFTVASTEADTQVQAQQEATVSRLWCYVTSNTVSATSTLTFRKNAGSGNQTVSITSSTTGAFEDTTHSDFLMAGDLINYQLVTGGSGTSLTITQVSMLYKSGPQITFLEPGGDADFAVSSTNGFWIAVAGVIATDFVHGNHKNSIKYLGAVNNFVKAPDGTLADAGSRISYYVYINVLPGATVTLFGAKASGGGGFGIFTLRMTSAGILQIWNAETAQIGTNGITLSTGQWYRISIAYTISSTTVNRFEQFVNGVSSISITNATLSGTGTSLAQFGGTGNASSDWRSSDHYIDNSSSLIDTGNIWVTAKRPFANGTTNGFTTQIGAGGSGYGTGHSPQVNERPLSTTNGWSMIGAGAAITEEYNIEGQSVGDITTVGGTIIDYTGWVSASSLTGETASIVVNNVTSNIALTSTNTLFTKVAGSTTYPAGTGTDIGIITSTTLTTVSLYECGIIVAFIPASTSISVSFLSILGAG